MIKGYLSIIIAVSIGAGSIGLLVPSIQAPAVIFFPIACAVGLIFLLIKLALSKKISEIYSYPFFIQKTLIFMALATGLNAILFFSAIQYSTVVNAVLARYTAPVLMVLIFGPLILKERITKTSLVAAGMAFSGMGIAFGPQLAKTLEWGILLGLAAAVFFALHTIWERKLALAQINPEIAVICKLAASFIIVSPFLWIYAQDVISLTSMEWFKIILLGLLVLSLALTLFFKGLKTVPASHVSTLLYVEPIGAIFLAFLFLGEKLSFFTNLGGFLVLAAGILMVSCRFRQNNIQCKEAL